MTLTVFNRMCGSSAAALLTKASRPILAMALGEPRPRPLGVLPHGAPEDEYDSEMEDLAALIAAGTPITPEVVATVWHEWFGETTGEPELPTSGMEALAADLQTCRPADLQTIQRHRAALANRSRSAQIIRMVTGSR